MIVLDTNVVSEAMRVSPDQAVVDWMDGQPARDLAITAVTAAELLYGVARLPGGARRTQIEKQVTTVINVTFAGRVLAFDGRAAACYATIVSEGERAGRSIPTADAQIAAICRAHRTILATRNTRDFEDVGVALHDPWRAV